MTEDDISKAFENISPQDFFRETSANHDTLVQGLSDADKDFNSFVESYKETARKRWDENDEFLAFCILQNSERERIFYADGDENVDDYARRLQREAANMDARWMFSALVGPARTYPKSEERDPINADNFEDVQRALGTGELQMSVCWYAKDRSTGRERCGIMTINNEDELDEEIEGVIVSKSNSFSNVMSF